MDSEVDVELNFVLENRDEEHDAKPQQYPSVLQEKEPIVAEAGLTGVVVQHLRDLRAQHKP